MYDVLNYSIFDWLVLEGFYFERLPSSVKWAKLIMKMFSEALNTSLTFLNVDMDWCPNLIGCLVPRERKKSCAKGTGSPDGLSYF